MDRSIRRLAETRRNAMARNAGAPPREERAEPSRAEIEQERRQMFEADEADLKLETGFVSM
jgi:hypothetical protein